MHELPDISTLTSEKKDELIRQLFPFLAEVRRLSQPVAMLDAQLSKNSLNSSKPPSSDGLSKKSQSLRQRSGKEAGGQAGHPGQTFERVSEPDEIIHCPAGAHHVRSATIRVQAPNPGAEASDRHPNRALPRGRTPQHASAVHLRPAHISDFPAEVGEPVQYGTNVRALAVHLTQG